MNVVSRGSRNHRHQHGFQQHLRPRKSLEGLNPENELFFILDIESGWSYGWAACRGAEPEQTQECRTPRLPEYQPPWVPASPLARPAWPLYLQPWGSATVPCSSHSSRSGHSSGGEGGQVLVRACREGRAVVYSATTSTFVSAGSHATCWYQVSSSVPFSPRHSILPLLCSNVTFFKESKNDSASRNFFFVGLFFFF